MGIPEEDERVTWEVPKTREGEFWSIPQLLFGWSNRGTYHTGATFTVGLSNWVGPTHHLIIIMWCIWNHNTWPSIFIGNHMGPTVGSIVGGCTSEPLSLLTELSIWIFWQRVGPIADSWDFCHFQTWDCCLSDLRFLCWKWVHQMSGCNWTGSRVSTPKRHRFVGR